MNLHIDFETQTSQLLIDDCVQYQVCCADITTCVCTASTGCPFPSETPDVGDNVYITQPLEYEVSQIQSDSCSNLLIGAPVDTKQSLRVSGSLTIGGFVEASVCSNTFVRGEGISNGYNSRPNFVFIEEKTPSLRSPGANQNDYALELSTQGGIVYSDLSDFNYTIAKGDDGAALVTYFASARVTGSTLLSIICNGDRENLVNGQPYPVQFLEVPPPTIVNATFSHSGTQITMNFTISTNKGGYDSIFDCAEILDPAYLSPFTFVNTWVGTGGFCFWTSSSVLVVQLGNNALPRVGDTIGVQGGKIAGIKPFQTLAVDAHGAILISPPWQDVPMILISTPRFLSPCSKEVVLDATPSLGTTGRDWYVPIQWFLVDSTVPGFAAIQAALTAQNTQMVVILDAALFTEGVDYVVEATAANHFGNVTSGRATFQRIPDESLEIDVLGGELVYVRWDAEMSLQAHVRNPCNLSVSSYEFAWTGVDEATSRYLAISKLQLDVKNLWIPAYSLNFNLTYMFNLTYTATLTDQSRVAVWDTITVVVDPTGDIYAYVVGGDRTIDRTTEFDLDPTHSVDTSGSLEQFSFKWNCQRASGTSFGLPCFEYQDDFLSTDRIHVDSDTLSQ
ncbi:MAG: hypothetical protein Q8P67_14275, partial [archaeon]|nr:hypothetical protein [archaeon]